MPSTYESMGCLPRPHALSSVSPEQLRKLNYRTTTSTGVSGRVQTHDDKWENFIDIHNLGKKDSKYMKYQLCTAPLLDRSAVTSRRDFIELPLGDNQINSALAESFKGGVNAGNKGLEVSAKNESAYKAEFCGYTGDLMKSAKQKSTKQKVGRTMTITGMTDMLETKALSHVTYSVPNGELAKKTPILHPPGNLGPAGKWDGPAPSSSYKTEFCREYKRENSLPDIKALAMHTGTASALLPDHHPAFKTKRVGYMSPGQ
jgi:hypothetical protein